MLNRPLRRSAPTLLLTRMQRGYVHLRSGFNPADDPTRRKPLRRARTPTPAWAAAVRSRGTVALEEAYPELAGRRGAAPGVFRYQDDYAPEPEETDGEARLPGPEPRLAARHARRLSATFRRPWLHWLMRASRRTGGISCTR